MSYLQAVCGGPAVGRLYSDRQTEAWLHVFHIHRLAGQLFPHTCTTQADLADFVLGQVC